MRIKIIPNNQLKALVALSNNSTFIQPQNNKQKIALYCLRYYCISDKGMAMKKVGLHP